MGKVGNKELCQVLIEKFGLTRNAAGQFVSEMFQVLMAGLHDDKQVKIKGLGTFKVTSVAARKSVDVNTGDPIIIEGRDKISFVPDTSLRDEVNRPFAQFETVVLNDDVDFTEIDRKFSEDSEAFVSEVLQSNDAILPESESVSASHTEETITIDSAKAGDESVDASVKIQESPIPAVVQTDKKENTKSSPITESTVIPVSECVSEEQKVGETVSERTSVLIDDKELKVDDDSSSSTTSPTCISDNVSEVEKNDQTNSMLEAAFHRQRGVVRGLIVVAVMLLLAFGGGIYYFLRELQLRDNRIEHLEAQMVQSTKPHAVRQSVTSHSVDSTTTKIEHLTTATNKVQRVLKSSQEAPDQKIKDKEENLQPHYKENNNVESRADKIKTERQSATKDAEYNRDARIRTGAYRVVGIDKTLTLRNGQTLASVSRSHLGDGMECYVEAVNGGKTEFKAGDKLNIPKLELKKKKHSKR